MDTIFQQQNISAGGTNKYFVAWDNPWRPVNDTPFVLAWSVLN